MSAYLKEASNGVNISVVSSAAVKEKWLDQKQWLLILFNTSSSSLCPKAVESNIIIPLFDLFYGVVTTIHHVSISRSCYWLVGTYLG